MLFIRWFIVALFLPVAANSRAGEPEASVRPQSFAVGEVRNFTLYDQPRPVPEIAIVGRDGQTYSLADFRGKVLLVNFWATWCGPCRREMPALDRLQSTLGGDDFMVVSISVDREGMEPAKDFLEEMSVRNLDLYLDQPSKAARSMGVYGMPTTYLIGREGREIGRLIGAAEWDSDDAIRLLRHVIGLGPREGAGAGAEAH